MLQRAGDFSGVTAIEVTMRTLVRIICGAVLFLLTAPVAFAQSESQPPPHPAISLKPNSGPAGSAFTISWSDFRPACRYIEFFWAGTKIAQSPPGPNQTGSVGTTVPANAKPGTYTVSASVPIGNCVKLTASAVFTVPAPPTTPVTSDPTTPTVPVTPPNPGSSTPPITRPDPSRPPLSPSNPPSTTTPPPSGTGTPPSTVDTPGPATPPADGELVLDHPSIAPGDPLAASGHGCTPGAPVTLTSGRDQVGATVAGADGTFTSPVAFTRIEAGKHQVTATCGVVLTGSVEQIVTSSTGGHSGTMIILVFFVLAGIAALRFN
jgi:hypothetical protein